MRKYFFLAAILFTLLLPSIARAATTSDGFITLNFYEDTQSGIENRWILDFNVNDADGPGGIEGLTFTLSLGNPVMNYENEFNSNPTADYIISSVPYPFPPAPGEPELLFPVIKSQRTIPVDSQFIFYAVPQDYITLGQKGILLCDNFSLTVKHNDNLGNSYTENFEVYGPMGFMPIPEPVSISLFLFGAFFLEYIRRFKKI